ncbi:MAG: chromosome segregation protein SMC [archaeon]|nr:chromosome segregation protein SMC [archaeon]
MYLRQIELENFKSFGGKVTIPLMEGYMAVTGPNGSGKSNISDAILFVLGPKSPKAVRAGRITDLIFSGGAGKPKAKFMKVALVFDNTDRILPWDDDTVRLTRYVKLNDNERDYQSLFFVNDRKSTLSEFDTLLTKARISADGYNLVQQGDVTRIVQMGNIERRRILDGISGITSFDNDLDKAKNERAEIKTNLDSIDILAVEKSKNLEILDREREQARIYKEAQAEKEVASAQLLHRQRDNAQRALQSVEEFISKQKSEMEELAVVRTKAIEDNRINEDAIAAKEQEIEDKSGAEYKKFKAQVEEVKVELASVKNKVELAQEDIESQNALKEEFTEELDSIRGEYDEKSKELDSLKSQLASANQEYERIKAEEASVNEETSKHGGELTKLQTRLGELEKAIDSAGSHDQELQAASASAHAVLERAKSAKAEAEEALSAAQFEVKDADWNLSDIKKTVGPDESAALSEKIFDLKRHEAALEKQEDELRIAADRRTAEFNRLSAEKKYSDSMNAGNEALSRILAMRDSGQISGIRGTVAELATVEPGYETALAIAAGGKMNAVVVDNDSVGSKCIEYLKSNRLARLTFLPINKMVPGKPRAKAIMVLKKTEGYATDFLQYSAEYANVFWFVFGDTLVVKNMDQGREIMGGVRIVTRDGELLEASGAMTGGTINKKNIAKFGATGQNALDSAAAEVKKANAALEELRAKIRNIREEVRTLDTQMRAASSKDVDAKGKIATAQATLDQAKKNVKNCEAALALRTKELEAAEQAVVNADLAANKSVLDMDSMKTERTEIRDRIALIAPAGLQERIQKIRDAVYTCGQVVADLSSQIATLSAERNGLEGNRANIFKQISEIDRKISENEEAIATYNRRISEITVTLNALKNIESTLDVGIRSLREERDALVEKRHSLDVAIQKAQSEIESKKSIIDAQETSATDHKVTIQELTERIAEIKIEVPLPAPSEEYLKRIIREKENKINSLGNVNLNSIDEYDRLKKEYDEMQAEVERLQKRIDELDELTNDLNSRKKGLFMETYNGVNENFKAIYAQLSGGGEGYMMLDNEEDPFAGGLQINAKPRNGKLLRLEALSGGEKSLTALSFIFAIQDYQPSPFYVLDEVDMFLDAVNTEMVAKRVKEASSKAQFIQVSLRKVALTMADHLIGVTRPPTGISRIIMQPDIAEVSKYEEDALKKQREMAEKEESSSENGSGDAEE